MTDYRSERKEKLSEEHLHGDDESNVVCIDKHLFLPAWIRNDEELPLITVHSPSKIFHGVSKGIGDAQNEVNVETSSICQPVCKRKSRKQRTGLHDGEARSLSVIGCFKKCLSEGLADSTSPTDFTLTINSKDEYLDRDWGRGLGEGLSTSASLTALTLTINSKDEYQDRDWGRYLGESFAKSSSLTAFTQIINSEHGLLGEGWGKGLGEGLAKSTSLTAFTLTINIEHGYLDGDWGISLGEGLKKSTSSTAFTLTINGEHGIQNLLWGKGLGEGLAERNERKRKECTIPSPSFDLDRHFYVCLLSYFRNRHISHREKIFDLGSPNFPKYSTKSISLGEGLKKSTSSTAFTLTINGEHGIQNLLWGKGLGEGLAERNERKRKECTIPSPSFDLDRHFYVCLLSYFRNRHISHREKIFDLGSPNFPKYSTKSTERKIRRITFAPCPDTKNERMRKECTMPFGNVRRADSSALGGLFPSFDLDRRFCLSPLSYFQNRHINHREKTLDSGSPNFPKCSTKSTERRIKIRILAPCPDTRNERMQEECTLLFSNVRRADSSALGGSFHSLDLDRGVCVSPRSFKRNRTINHGEKTLDSGSLNFSKYSTKLTERKIKRCIVPPCPDTRNERMQEECTMLFSNVRRADSSALGGSFHSLDLDRGVCVSPRSFKRNRTINHGEKTLDSGSLNFSKYSTKLTERKIKRCIVPLCPDTRNERMQRECTKKCGDKIFCWKRRKRT